MRRKYYINKRFQTKFIAKIIFVLILGTVLSVVITMFTNEQTLTSSFEGSELIIEKTSLAILPSVIFTSLLTMVVVAVVVIVITLLVSHKIAGPMYRFEKDIEEIAEGNLAKNIKIRDGDEFGAVAVSLNRMVQKLNYKLSTIKTEVGNAIEATQKVDAADTSILEDLKKIQKSIEDNFTL